MPLARRFDDPKVKLTRAAHWLPAALITIVPFALVLKEPDLGTSLAFPVILVVLLYWGGMPLRQLVLGLTPFVNAAVTALTGSPWWFAVAFAGLLVALRPRWPALVVLVLLNLTVAIATPQVTHHCTTPPPHRDVLEAGNPTVDQFIVEDRDGLEDHGQRLSPGTQKRWAFLPCDTRTSSVRSWEELGLSAR